MTYRLYRVAVPGGDVDSGSWLGDFDSYDDALRARDDDAVRTFRRTPRGDVLLACHQILGPGAAGPCTAHPVTTELPRSATADVARDVADTEAWLRAVHRAS